MAQHVVGWRAWFTGGLRFDSAAHSWGDLPDDGCLAIRLYFDEVLHGNRLSRTCSGSDFYWRSVSAEGDIYAHSNDTREDIEARYPGAVICRGQWTSDAEIQRVNEEMNDATETP